MRKIIGTAIVALGALLVAGSGSASAAPDTLKVNIPFAFMVKGQTYQPGAYKVERDEQNPWIVRIVGDNGNHSQVIIVTIPASGHDPAGEKPALTFDRDGTQYEFEGHLGISERRPRSDRAVTSGSTGCMHSPAAPSLARDRIGMIASAGGDRALSEPGGAVAGRHLHHPEHPDRVREPGRGPAVRRGGGERSAGAIAIRPVSRGFPSADSRSGDAPAGR